MKKSTHGVNRTPGEVFILLKTARTVEFDAEQTILRQGEVGSKELFTPLNQNCRDVGVHVDSPFGGRVRGAV